MTAYSDTVDALLAELGDSWPSTEQITAVREHLIARMPGWEPPAAYAIGTVEAGEVVFARVNIGIHPLPAAVLSTLLDRTAATASYEVDAAFLAEAIRLLAPAEACTAYEHPNLAVWRSVLAALSGGTALIVFDADPERPSDDPGVLALREYAAREIGLRT